MPGPQRPWLERTRPPWPSRRPEPLLPVARGSVQVHDGDNDELHRFDAEQNSIREGSRQATTHICLDDGAKGRSGLNTVDGILNRSKEPSAETFPLSFVVCGGGVHLGFRIGMETNRLHPSAACAFAKTSSA